MLWQSLLKFLVQARMHSAGRDWLLHHISGSPDQSLRALFAATLAWELAASRPISHALYRHSSVASCLIPAGLQLG